MKGVAVSIQEHLNVFVEMQQRISVKTCRELFILPIFGYESKQLRGVYWRPGRLECSLSASCVGPWGIAIPAGGKPRDIAVAKR